MNSKTIPSQLTEPTDILLADVAIRVQLSRTDYNKAVDRYQTINDWIERDGSPLKDLVQRFYPQGSMAISATIASKLKTDEFDIDLVVQLGLSKDVSPSEPLDLLFKAIRGEPGSRYYRITTRRTRCVAVDYSDDMHIDVTPVIRRLGTQERESWLFHDRPEAPQEQSDKLIANPYGFAGEMQAIMMNLFGEAPTAEVFRAFNERLGKEVRDGRSQHRPNTGSRIIPTTAAGTSVVVSAPKHTFFGDQWYGQ